MSTCRRVADGRLTRLGARQAGTAARAVRVVLPVIAMLAAIALAKPVSATATPGDGHNVGGSVVARDRLAGVDPLPQETGLIDGTLPADVAAEPSIAADPAQPRLAVTTFIDGVSQAIGVAHTADGGNTWTSAVLPGTVRCHDLDPEPYCTGVTGQPASAGVVDPVVAWGVDSGATEPVYVAFLRFTRVVDGFGLDLDLSVSHDGGATWGEPKDVFGYGAFVPVIGPHVDRPSIAVDTGSGPGHHPGRIYLVWATEPDGLPMATFSDDEGASWQSPPSVIPPRVAPNIGTVPTTHGSDFTALVLADGSLGIVYDTGDYQDTDPNIGEEYRFVSAPAPAPGSRLSFGAPMLIAPAHHRDEDDLAGALDTSAAAVDPVTGRVWVAWADNTRTGGGLNDVVLSSWAGGPAWATPVAVSPASDNGDHFHPALAVDHHGVVRVGWRFRPVDDTGALGSTVDTYERDTAAGASTSSPPLKVNEQRTDLHYARAELGPAFLGDYDGMAVSGNLTYVTRAEAYCPPSLAPCEEPHQRIWVAVLTVG